MAGSGAGEVLNGRYVLDERVGSGGMGIVWRATDRLLGRQVAVKVLQLPPGTSERDRERMLAMFTREARAAAALDHPGIAPLYDHGTDGEVPYLVMPLLRGTPLQELLESEGAMPPERVAHLASQVARALASAHAAGIVHRDIKPANILVTPEETVRVVDFGLAKFLDATGRAGLGRLTQTSDSVVGTLAYMAPERFTRAVDGGPADVYSLGCTVREMLSGNPPFEATSAAELMHAHLYEPPRPLADDVPELAGEWDALVSRMLEKDPARRPSAYEAAELLERAGHRPPGPADPRVAAPGSPPSAGPYGPLASPWGPAAANPYAAPGQPPTSYHLTPPTPAPPQTRPTVSTAKRLRDPRWIAAGALVAVGALLGALFTVGPLGDRGSGGGSGGGEPKQAAPRTESAKAVVTRTEEITRGGAKDAGGPARPVTGAERGGTVRLLTWGSLDVPAMDPVLSWDERAQSLEQLVYRGLTGYRYDGNGAVRLVGDLATDTGTMARGGRQWTFHLKKGLTYEDGQPVTAQDVEYAVERSFDPDHTSGDPGVRIALFGETVDTYSKQDPRLPERTIETPDARTIVFHLAYAEPEFDVALAGTLSAPFPARLRAKDITKKFMMPPATGPYRIADQADDRLTLVRNPKWSAASDPIRTAYPDRYEVQGQMDEDAISDALDSAAPGEAVGTLAGSSLKGSFTDVGNAQSIAAPGSLVYSLMVDARRIPQLSVRQAIAIAVPATALLDKGGDRGKVVNGVMAPGVAGHNAQDVLGAGREGDPDRARALLKGAGQLGRTLKLATGDGDTDTQLALIRGSLEQAGFKVTVHDYGADSDKYTDDAWAGKYDLFTLYLGDRHATSSTYLARMFASRYGPHGTWSNYSEIDSDTIDSAIDTARSAPGLESSRPLWANVDREVVKEAAAVPLYVLTPTFLYTTALKGVRVGILGMTPTSLYVDR
ncbi:ABC transporter substrate-binding protein [Streptomyces sp. VRA16 Mangrove soil]|uniref:protein kinase domain-containing protein n=1 Tax=Streptomyces sp. VRA16 Mangrove soil TaxID=2817434 RepID=UPI001A9D51A1|nr:ABC transporter substrate-binding protein [Streptomyces sp. VRA16 Mangrove soil]MBO1337683.1 protein kinase [Streptomyces sp. VRA16 Mangrove soil]